ncbi:hypothetical protein NKJ08_03495 [Mesorhizobium sp. M0244]
MPPKISPVWIRLVTAVLELPDSLFIFDAIAVEGEVLDSVALTLEEVGVDRLPSDRLNDLPIHVRAVGQTELDREIGEAAPIGSLQVGAVHRPGTTYGWEAIKGVQMFFR